MKATKIVMLLLLFLIIVCSITSVFAIDTEEFRPDPIEAPDVENLFSKVGPVVKILRNIGILMSGTTLTMIGAQYVMGSSLEQKAQIKEKLFPLLCGCLLIVFIFVIIDIVISYTNNI